MAQIILMGAAEDLGDAGMLPSSGATTATQARNLDRLLMLPAKPQGALQNLASGLDAGANMIAAWSNQAVQVIDAATRVKLASQAAKQRLSQATTIYQNPLQVLPPVYEVPWTDQEMLPGVRNLYLLLGLGAVLAGVLLLKRKEA